MGKKGDRGLRGRITMKGDESIGQPERLARGKCPRCQLLFAVQSERDPVNRYHNRTCHFFLRCAPHSSPGPAVQHALLLIWRYLYVLLCGRGSLETSSLPICRRIPRVPDARSVALFKRR